MASRRQKPWKQPHGVAKGVGSVVAKLSLGPQYLELQVANAWRDAVGDSIARRSSAGKLDRGTLHVVVESPAWTTELRFIEKDIVQRVNERFAIYAPMGPKAPVKRLFLQVGALPAPPPKPVKPLPLPPATAEQRREVEARLQGIEDPDVRTAAREMLLRAMASDAAVAARSR